MGEQKFISMAQVCSRWGCTKPVVVSLMSKGILEGFKLNPDKPKSDWRVSLESIERYEQGLKNKKENRVLHFVPQAEEQDTLVSEELAMKTLKCDLGQLKSLVQTEQLPCTVAGPYTVLFKVGDLEAYINANSEAYVRRFHQQNVAAESVQ